MERLRGQLATGLTQRKGDVPALASDDFNALLWGPQSPRGISATLSSLRSITVEDLRRFHRTWFAPNNAVIAVSGDTTPSEIGALLEQSLVGWKPRRLPARKVAALLPARPRSIILTDVPSASQSHVLIGWHIPPLTDPDAFPLMVINAVLGGEFSSRLNQNIRETRGLSYGVWSRLRFWRGIGSLSASGDIHSAGTAEAILEFEKELERLRTGDLTEAELSRAKEILIHGIPEALETNEAMVTAIASRVGIGVPLDYYATLPARVRAVTGSEAVAAATKYITPDRWPIVVVGPKSQILEPLRKLGLGDIQEVPAD